MPTVRKELSSENADAKGRRSRVKNRSVLLVAVFIGGALLVGWLAFKGE